MLRKYRAAWAYWVSEYGESADLEALLRHADEYFTPSWHRGGLYYQRSDTGWDDKGNYTYVEPVTGAAAIAYARRNVRHGQKKMWGEPWTKSQVENRPWIDGVYLEQGIGCLRGQWDEQSGSMIATFRSWDGSVTSIKPVVKNLLTGTYGVYVDGTLKDVTTVHDLSDEVKVELDVGQENVDLVLKRALKSTLKDRRPSALVYSCRGRWSSLSPSVPPWAGCGGNYDLATIEVLL